VGAGSDSFYFRPDHESLVDMEVAVTGELGVEVCFIQCGAFFQAYNKSAEVAATELGYKFTATSNGCPMAGFPVAGLQTLLNRMKRLGLSFAIIEEVGESRKRGRRLRAVTHIFPEVRSEPRPRATSVAAPRSTPRAEPARARAPQGLRIEPRAGPLLKAKVLESREGTVVVSPDGEILQRIPEGTTTSIDWFLREATKRLNYPRHGQRWDDAEDELLRQRAASGLGVSQLARLHERAPGGIRSRLEKLGIQR